MRCCLLDMASASADDRQMYHELLGAGNSVLIKKVRTYWDSSLFDLLSEALARLLLRPLRIFFFVMAGEIRTTMAGAQHEGPAVTLMRTFTELGYDHSDAIVA